MSERKYPCDYALERVDPETGLTYYECCVTGERLQNGRKTLHVPAEKVNEQIERCVRIFSEIVINNIGKTGHDADDTGESPPRRNRTGDTGSDPSKSYEDARFSDDEW